MRTDVRTLSLFVVLVSGAAFAGGADQVLGEIAIRLIAPTLGATSAGTFALSTEGSKASSQGSSQQSANAVPPAECEAHSDCHAAWACRAGRCVAPEPAPVGAPPPAVSVPAVPSGVDGRCGQDSDCASGLVCRASYCAIPEQVRLKDEATHVFLAARAVELREELLLGKGPVIATLANVTAVPAPKLGQTLRAHRTELIALIGDGSDPHWSARFMKRVNVLVAA